MCRRVRGFGDRRARGQVRRVVHGGHAQQLDARPGLCARRSAAALSGRPRPAAGRRHRVAHRRAVSRPRAAGHVSLSSAAQRGGNCNMSAEPGIQTAVTTPLHRDAVNALRALAMDAVQQANSGHPGMPMGMAEIAEVLWRRHLRHNPTNPKWPDRDRFVLSNGHGSMLLYALLHLSGYDLPLAQLRRFRQLHSTTPGHPEYAVTPGVETTTGPLGQGISNAVGMAIAEQLLAQEFNRPGFEIVAHHTYVFLGDGCMMEGISHEACSLAGTLGLGKLVAIYDDNGISIDGHVEHWFTDDTPARFEAYGWRVIRDVPGHDSAAIEAALGQACKEGDRPTLVCCKTVIGHGSPHKSDTHEVHGAALGAAEVAATRAHLGWTAVPFEIPPEIRAAWDATTQGAARHTDWRRRFAAYAA